MSDRVATDVGGTFTDLVLPAHRLRTAAGRRSSPPRSDTTPPDFERGVLDVIARAGVDATDVGFLVHGTTVVINALTERKGVTTALITTEGFRDSLEIARGNRPDFFNLFYEKPRAVRAAPPAARGAGPARADGRRARSRSTSTGLPAILDDFRAAGRRGGRDLPAARLRQPARTRWRCCERVRELWPEVSVGRLAPDHARVARVRAHQHRRCSRPTCSRSPSATSTRLRARPRRPTASAASSYIMQSNCGVDTVAHVKRDPDHDGRVRAGERVLGRRRSSGG